MEKVNGILFAAGTSASIKINFQFSILEQKRDWRQE
jgi:hypothetical protein